MQYSEECISTMYLWRKLFLIVVLEAYSFVSVVSSTNECKRSKCRSPLLSPRILSISEVIFLKFFFLERLNITIISEKVVLKSSFTTFSIVSKNVEKHSSSALPVFPQGLFGLSIDLGIGGNNFPSGVSFSLLLFLV